MLRDRSLIGLVDSTMYMPERRDKGVRKEISGCHRDA